MPPPVLPAQAPINIKSTRIVFGIVGQRLKSTGGEAGGRDDGSNLKRDMVEREEQGCRRNPGRKT